MKKKYIIGCGVLIVFVLIGLLLFFIVVGQSNEQKDYSFAQLGVTEPVHADCSSVKNQDTTQLHSVSITFNASDVSGTREKIKALALKFGGTITGDSFYAQVPGGGQTSANVSVIFKKSENDFLAGVNDIAQSLHALNDGYSFNDQSNGNSGSYGSVSSSCLAMLQSVWYNKEQLDIFMHALTREHDTVKIGIIGQSISSTQSSLQSSINNFDQFFTQNNQPTVTITINQSSSAPVPRVGGI